MKEKKKILWVEDDADIIKYVVDPLKKQGFEIINIESLADFKKLKNKLDEYALILVDLIIPQQDDSSAFIEYPGLELIRILRSDWSSTIPVIALTVVKSDNIVSDLQKYGVNDVLFKPVRSQVLKDAVNNIIGSPLK